MLKPALTMTLVIVLAAAAAAQSPTPATRPGSLPAPPPAAGETLALLSYPIPDVSFRDVPFEQIVEWLGQMTGANIIVRWRVLSDWGIRRDSPVTLKARHLTVAQVLWLLLNEVGGQDLRLAYRASGSLIILSTEEDLGREMLLKVYDVRDLLTTTLRTPPPDMDVSSIMNAGGGAAGGSSGGSGIFSGRGSSPGEDAAAANEAAEIERIVTIVRETIEPDSWTLHAGQGTIHAYNGLLIIYNTPLVHQKVGGYLEELVVGE